MTISGARYSGVPHSVYDGSLLFLASPKSTSLRSPRESRTRLSGFRSRYMMRCECRYERAETMQRQKERTSSTGSRPRRRSAAKPSADAPPAPPQPTAPVCRVAARRNRWPRSPPRHASVMRYVLRLRTSTCEPKERTMKSCRDRAISNSSVRGSTHVAREPSSCDVTLSANRVEEGSARLPPAAAGPKAPIRGKPRSCSALPAGPRRPPLSLPHAHWPVQPQSRTATPSSSPPPQTMQPPPHGLLPLPSRTSWSALTRPLPSPVLSQLADDLAVPSSQTVPDEPVPSTLRKPETGDGAYSSSLSKTSSSAHVSVPPGKLSGMAPAGFGIRRSSTAQRAAE
mmetsp:Transcript_35372/g.113960  ORF Transcript_35372/g.113960 Transcript_35372/m.113960 type:complete len:341 (+) Transcript_35372:271-1293(+)